jgi:hypothetical protein
MDLDRLLTGGVAAASWGGWLMPLRRSDEGGVEVVFEADFPGAQATNPDTEAAIYLDGVEVASVSIPDPGEGPWTLRLTISVPLRAAA